MTKKQIEQYGGICDQIVALRSMKVIDTVQGSSREIPYQKRTISIEGTPEESKSGRLKALVRKKAEIEAAVESIPKTDGTNRAIVEMRILGRMGWKEIATSLGYHVTQEGVRKAYNRAMKKYF